MAYVIALAGKGGTGKTTIAALLVRLLAARKLGPVLAVDADPNANLGEVLGVPAQATVGDILDAVSRDPDRIPAGMTKDRFVEYQVQTAVHEAQGFDLLTMGKPEGPGCYCYVNNILRAVIERLVQDYAFVVIDNEAGLEHLSRRTTRRADFLLVVAQPAAVALRAAQRIRDLAEQLQIRIGKTGLLLNAVQGTVDARGISETGLPLIGTVAYDQRLQRLSVKSASLAGLGGASKALVDLEKILDTITG